MPLLSVKNHPAYPWNLDLAAGRGIRACLHLRGAGLIVIDHNRPVAIGDADSHRRRIGVKEHEHFRPSVSGVTPLQPVSHAPRGQAKAEIVIKEQRDKGEAYIGKITKYVPETKEAHVYVEIGLIQKEDRIHVKGQVTDFYQDVTKLMAYGAKAERVTTGYTGLFRAYKPCAEGDFVYIVCKRGIPPFFLAPLGVAAIVAGAVPLHASEEEILSPYKIK